jgi:DNA-binding transcriptional ArsR family regulator
MSAIEAIFPKVRAEMLRLLFAEPSRELHLRELTRLSGLTIGTVQQEVARLKKADLLQARRDGNRLYYRANALHPIFPELRQIALKTTGLRDQLANALENPPGIDLAFVFGSAASGATGATSDVDLMVIGKIGLRTLAPLLRPVTTTIGREVNPHVLAATTFTTKARSGDAFLTNVIKAPKIWIIGDSDELGKLA